MIPTLTIPGFTCQLRFNLNAALCEEEGLPEAWLNDGVKGFQSEKGKYTSKGLHRPWNLALQMESAHLNLLQCEKLRGFGGRAPIRHTRRGLLKQAGLGGDQPRFAHRHVFRIRRGRIGDPPSLCAYPFRKEDDDWEKLDSPDLEI